MKILCKIFGHKMFFDTYNIYGSATCKRCGYNEASMDWSKISPMPEYKQPLTEGEMRTCVKKQTIRDKPIGPPPISRINT